MTKRMIDLAVLMRVININSYVTRDDYTDEKIDVIETKELLDAINGLAENNAENAEPDPWCYDLTEISQHKEVMIRHVFEGKKEFMHWFTDDLNHPQCPEIIAWMPIPKPKGATNV